ncbi:MAG: hypothetical protein ACTHJ2_07520, partial [Candidatus Nitrosocosmicus sp.]
MHKPFDDDRNIKDDINVKNKESLKEELNSIEQIEHNNSLSAEKDQNDRFHTYFKRNKINLDEIANTILFISSFIGIWQLVYLLGIWPQI